jgi:hypothetical protein
MERRRRVLFGLTRGLQTDTQKVGKAPREALDARRKATGVANGSIPADMSETTDGATHTPGISLEDGIEQYLEAVRLRRVTETELTATASNPSLHTQCRIVGITMRPRREEGAWIRHIEH